MECFVLEGKKFTRLPEDEIGNTFVDTLMLLSVCVAEWYYACWNYFVSKSVLIEGLFHLETFS